MARCLASLLLALIALGSGAQGDLIPWIRNPNAVVPQSSDRPIFLFFHDGQDLASQRMMTWTFTNPGAAQTLEGIVPIRISRAARPALAEQFGVTDVPTCLLVAPDGSELARHIGLMEAQAFGEWVAESRAAIVSAASPPGESSTDLATDDGAVSILGPSPPPFGQQRQSADASPTDVEARHRPVVTAREGEDIPIQVYVPGGADRVVLHHRLPSESSFAFMAMTPSTPTLYYAAIPGGAVTLEGLEYYVTVERGSRVAAFPPEGPGRPHRVAVR